MRTLLRQISTCKLCADFLPHGPNPIVQAAMDARIVIIGQAPGQKVHQSGIPWDDKSGDELRRWLGVTSEQFYDRHNIALVPMGFCYPGKGKSGDLPPRPECAPQWHPPLLKKLTKVKLILLVGRYSQAHYLGDEAKPTLTETVRNFQEYLPRYFPLVHPSPRNRIWMKKNGWFEKQAIPALRKLVKAQLADR